MVLTEDYIIGEGLVSDQSATVHFGLGKDQIKRIQVKYIDGQTQEITDFKINTSSLIPKMQPPEAEATTEE